MDSITRKCFQQAGSFQERVEAVKLALCRGVSLSEIEQDLDWLDGRSQQPSSEQGCVAREQHRHRLTPANASL
jgi:hypothetical protein